MTKATWLDRGIARPAPYITLCLSRSEFIDAMYDLGSEELPLWVSPNANATTHILDDINGDLACVVCIKNTEGKTGVQIACLLVHEAVHVWQHYCDRIGERNPGTEQEAYGIQNIAQTLMEAYAEKTK